MQMLSQPSAHDESAEEKQVDEVMQISTNTTACMRSGNTLQQTIQLLLCTGDSVASLARPL